ncbi:hypothetical protein FRC03_008173 [Tulasnella sp. 419]|nr:hypothetical protein FRC02_003298 [Tulasnella sp. 418]KAG8959299.1 hypothetical protein FRC03_008173 [Tulasnella sp. 419]
MVSQSPVSAPQSPHVVYNAPDRTPPPPPPPHQSSFKIPPQKGRKLCACPDCGKVFNRLSACQQHRRRHTGEKPHRCQICNVGFASKSNLKRHAGSQKCRRKTTNYRARQNTLSQSSNLIQGQHPRTA